MSATLDYEPHRLPAGILAASVHGAFFALLYFGFSWQTFTPAMMTVELWQSLPDQVVAPPAKPSVEEVVKPVLSSVEGPVQPEKAVKPDIALPDKKRDATPADAPKPAKKKKEPKPVMAKPVEKKPAEQKPGASIANQQLAQERAEKAAATDRVVAEYKAKIKAKIRREIVMIAKVPEDATAVFSVTLLPGGSVLEAKLDKSSGNAAYDSAVENAIRKAVPLPLPPDVQLFREFRELRMTFKPEKKD